MLGERAISGVTARAHARQVSACSRGRYPKPGTLTVVVGADLEGLVAAHDEADLLGLLVLEQSDVTGAALLPLGRVGNESEQLGAPGKTHGQVVRFGFYPLAR